MPVIAVTAATPGDAPAIARLLAEMDDFYGAPSTDPPDQRARQVGDVLFTDPPAAHALVARDGGRLVGIAAYSFLWPAIGLTRSLYLKELYVAQDARRHGVGDALMRSVFQAAARHRCSRVEWTTDTGNIPAQDFYASKGFEILASKLFYRAENIPATALVAESQLGQH
jgi:GNAT superfamily N-acetyltransferase